MKVKIFIGIIILEVIIILILITSYYKKPSVIQTSSNMLFRKGFAFQKDNKSLQYYYEPQPNAEVVVELHQFGKDYQYSIKENFNNDTLHQTSDVALSKEKDTFRIIALGDSFTFGSNLNTKETYPSQLEKILNTTIRCKNIQKFEVLNLGVAGYDIQYIVERFKQRGKKYNPDLVLWFIIEDDLRRVNELMMSKILYYGREMRETGELKRLEKVGIYNADYKKARAEVIRELGEEKILTLQKKYLQEFNKLYQKDLVIFTFSRMQDTYKNFLKKYTDKRPDTFLYTDLININKHEGVLPDYHPNKKGAKMIAEDITKFILKNNLIRCK